jgi:predicted kinase
MTFTIPELSLVVLIGPSGCGKSTFARKHFKPTEVMSSDGFRALVSDDENDQSSTDDAFAALHFVAARRLARGKLTVVDATNVQPEARKPLVALAREYHVLPVAIVIDLPEGVDAKAVRTVRASVEAEATRLRNLEANVRRDTLTARYQDAVHLNQSRLQLYPWLGSRLRSEIAGFGPSGLDQAQLGWRSGRRRATCSGSRRSRELRASGSVGLPWQPDLALNEGKPAADMVWFLMVAYPRSTESRNPCRASLLETEDAEPVVRRGRPPLSAKVTE